jgi:multidrug resistance efflux pump
MNRKRIFIFAVLAAVAIAIVFSMGLFRHGSGLEGSGTVEARNIRVGSKIAGRIDKVLVREGDKVESGQVLVTFDDKELQASLQQSRATAEKAVRGFRPEEIAEARGAAERAEVARAHAEEQRTQADFNRYEALAKDDLVPKQQRDAAEAAWKMAAAQLQSAEKKLEQLEHGYRPEEVAAARARYQQARATLEKLKHGNRREDIAQAKAAYSLDEARYREREVTAPVAATVEVLDVRPGDLIAPNTPVATLLERDQIYVRIYIPETEIGRVHLGQKGEVRVDSLPNEVFEGVVEQINQQAEFLPRNVQTRDERVHQVFGVKLRIVDPSGRVRPGIAADVKLKMGS